MRWMQHFPRKKRAMLKPLSRVCRNRGDIFFDFFCNYLKITFFFGWIPGRKCLEIFQIIFEIQVFLLTLQSKKSGCNGLSH